MSRKLATLAVVATLALFAVACGNSGGGGESENFEPGGPVDLLVHTGPGGGSDVFAREVSEMLVSEDIVDDNWPVVNRDGGDGALAMAYMSQNEGNSELVAAITPTWIATSLTADVEVTIEDMTPVVGLLSEPTVMAVRDDAPYDDLQGFIDAANEQPNELVQTGGSTTASDAIAGQLIMEETGAEWKYLSFPGGGERIAALLGGDADMMFGSSSDFTEQVEAGDLKVIATIDNESSPIFPDAETLEESGIEADVPRQFRGVVGPPGMPDDAVAYYEGVFEELSKTEAWKEYAEDNGLNSDFRSTQEWSTFLEERNTEYRQLLDELGLLNE